MTTESRYGNQDLFLPKNFHTEFKDRLVDQSKEHVPFHRQIDLWWYALGVGVTMDKRTPLPDRSHLVKFNSGDILESDPWRITHLELLALSEEGQRAVSNPAKVIRIANEYVMTGSVTLEEELRDLVDPQNHLITRSPSSSDTN